MVIGVRFKENYKQALYSSIEFDYKTNIADLEVGDLILAETRYGKTIGLVSTINKITSFDIEKLFEITTVIYSQKQAQKDLKIAREKQEKLKELKRHFVIEKFKEEIQAYSTINIDNLGLNQDELFQFIIELNK